MGGNAYWSEAMRRRVSRRGILHAGMVAGTGLWLGSTLGCGSGKEENKSAGSTANSVPTMLQPRYGGILVRRDVAEPRSMDPDFETTPYAGLFFTLANNGLIKFNRESTKILPDIAESWERPDDVTYIFKLRKGVKFHNVPPVNGREFVADDAKWSVERQMTDNAAFSHAYFFKGELAKIEAVDNYTVKFVTNQPYAAFLNWMANPFSVMKCREAVDKYGDLKTVAIGTGPFVFKEYKKGIEAIFVKNPDYFVKGKPYLDEIHTRYVPDPSTAVTMFVGGDLDVAGIDAAVLARTKKQKADATYIDGIESNYPFLLRTQPYDDTHPHKPPFDNKQVRQALLYATDKQEYINLASDGNGIPMVGMIPSSRTPWALPESDQIKQNIPKAKLLLAEGGYPNGFKMEIVCSTVTSAVDSAQVAKGQLAKIGIDAEVKALEDAQYRNKIYAYDFMLNLHNTAGNPEPEYYLKTLFGEDAYAYRWGNKEIWKKIAEQSRTMDEQKRLQLIHEIQRMLIDDAPVVALYVATGTTGVQRRVKGYQPAWNQNDFSYYEDVWLSE